MKQDVGFVVEGVDMQNWNSVEVDVTVSFAHVQGWVSV